MLTAADLAQRIDSLLTEKAGAGPFNTSSKPAYQYTYQFENAQTQHLTKVAGETYTGWRAWTEGEKAGIRIALAKFEAVLNVKFVEVTGASSPNINFGLVSLNGPAGTGGWYRKGNDHFEGFAVFEKDRVDLTTADGINNALHEIGHILTAKHIENLGSTEAPFFPESENNDKFSVMSYHVNPDNGLGSDNLMVYDIAALQSRWGANLLTANGNDAYSAPVGGRIQSIWDTGGDDTIDGSAQTRDVKIDLYNGNFSSIGATDNFSIAYGVVIENGFGGSGNDTLTGNDIANRLVGNAGNDTMNGNGGPDTLEGGSGDDTYVNFTGDTIVELPGGGSDTLQVSTTFTLTGYAEIENVALSGSANIDATGNDGANRLTGNSGNNKLVGGLLNDTLIGGAGTDTLEGGLGDDLYVDVEGDTIVELADGGLDSIQTNATFSLGSTLNIEGLVLGGIADVNGYGDALNNRLVGNAGRNELKGDAGNDTLDGGAANDTLDGGTGNDSVLGGTGDDAAEGGAGLDTVDGGDGNDRLAGGADADRVVGGLGNDNADGGDGNDTVLGGDGADTVAGAIGDDQLEGGAGDDTLIGGAGTDKLLGGTGDDTYLDPTGDGIVEQAGEGNDIVLASGNFSLAAIANVERLTLLGAGNANGTGNALANLVLGSGGHNQIDGADGNDTLQGAGGNDTLIGGGNDDSLEGGDGNDTLEGRAGTDTLVGGAGNDTYVDIVGDTMFEAANGGSDTIKSSVALNLIYNNIENIVFTGLAAINSSGNNLDNRMDGNDAANALDGNEGSDTLNGNGGNDTLDGDEGDDTLNGGAGNDTLTDDNGINLLQGGAGDDTYLYPGANRIVELASEGTDTIVTNAAFSLVNMANVEALVLTGGNSVALTGNTLNNTLTGGAGENTISGGEGNDTLNGGGGNDTLIGGSGADALAGGLGNDTYIDPVSDTIVESAGEGTDTVQSAAAFSLARTNNVEWLVLTGAASVAGTGNALANKISGNTGANALDGGEGDDSLSGGDGNDTLTGGGGADTLAGGAGDDTYLEPGTDRITELAAAGIDTVLSSVTFTLSNIVNVERLTLTGAAAANGTGNTLDNLITGNDAANALTGGDGNDTVNGAGGNDTMEGGNGADSLVGGSGDDTYLNPAGDTVVENAAGGTDTIVSNVAFSLADLVNVENLSLTGGSAITGTGNALANLIAGNNIGNALSGAGGDDTLNGGAGNDTLNGGSGTDTLAGGIGDDTYVDAAADIIVEAVGEGTDTIQSATAFSLARIANVESLTLTGTASVSGTGNALANLITGNSGGNALDGGEGDDTLNGGAGNDTLTGGLGFDTLAGGADNDTYLDPGTDRVSELVGAGTDTILSSVTYTLAPVANVERLTLTGVAAANATGNALDNLIVGNDSANVLTGGDGNDTLNGGGGNDTFEGGNGVDSLRGGSGNDTYLNPAGDGIVEKAGDGADTVLSNVTFSLAAIANVEHLTLTGGGVIDGTGNALSNLIAGNNGANALSGGDGNDTLNGGLGNDTLTGGAGADILDGGADNDTYIDPTGDRIVEAADAGNDLILSSLSYSLENAANVERLELTGVASLTGTGNALNNVITGNAGLNALTGGDGNDSLLGGGGADTLTGGNGIDTLVGGADNDTYVDPTGDRIDELAGGGIDTVLTGVSFTLNPVANVERLTLTGAADIAGTGNLLANLINGNSGANALTGGDGNDTLNGGLGNDTLSGGLGADTLAGGAGNDVYLDTAGDLIVENAGDGLDTVQSTVTFSLAQVANVEILALIGGSKIDGTGNAMGNLITGNAGGNILSGLDGNDTLEGGDGHDTLIGGSGTDVLRGGIGNDVYVDTAGDTIEELDGQGTDLVQSSTSVSIATAANVEWLTLTGAANISGVGNALSNQITGNTGNNMLDAGDGTDLVTGAAGNDTLLGGAGADTMSGNEGDDSLNGGDGIDSLRGGVGNDTYVDPNGDQIIELLGEGTDTVQSAVTFSISQIGNLERLCLTGASDIDGIGNNLANLLTGNTGNNLLDGAAENDTLNGGAGNDTLIGGAGNDVMNGEAGLDVFRFSRAATGNDTITGFNRGEDKFDLSGALFTGVSEAGGTTTLVHGGGSVIVTGVAGLNLAQWNALVIPAGGGIQPASASYAIEEVAPVHTQSAGLAFWATAHPIVGWHDDTPAAYDLMGT